MTSVALPSLRTAARRARHEADGSLLVEVMVSALVLIGALSAAVLMFSNAESTAGDTRMRAVAASVAEKDQGYLQTLGAAEIESVAGSERSTSVEGFTFTVKTRVSKIDPQTVPVGCQRPTGGHLSLQTTVDWASRDRYGNGGRRPVVVVSNVARPGAGRPGTGEAMLVIRDAAGRGVGGVPVRLQGGATRQRNTDASTQSGGQGPAGSSDGAGRPWSARVIASRR